MIVESLVFCTYRSHIRIAPCQTGPAASDAIIPRDASLAMPAARAPASERGAGRKQVKKEKEKRKPKNFAARRGASIGQ